jgi:hypothetical protein
MVRRDVYVSVEKSIAVYARPVKMMMRYIDTGLLKSQSSQAIASSG